MKLVSSGCIQRLFAESDRDTILRRPNIRRYAKENGVTYYVIQSVWLIDIDGFMQTIAPKEYPSNSTMPRLRCIQTAVKEYNQSHERQIDKHVVEKCMLSDKVFKYHHGNRWISITTSWNPSLTNFWTRKLV